MSSRISPQRIWLIGKFKDSPLQAEIKGQAQLTQFVSKQLLMRQQESQQAVQQFYVPIKRNSPATFKSLPTKSKEQGKDTILKADRTVLRNLITAYGAGRTVDMQMVMQHELLPVLIALVEMNGQLICTGTKSILADVLLSGINCPKSVEAEGSSCLIIDDNDLIVAIGGPQEDKTFRYLADVFMGVVMYYGRACQQIHVTFDRYWTDSIKSATREKRTGKRYPI